MQWVLAAVAGLALLGALIGLAEMGRAATPPGAGLANAIMFGQVLTLGLVFTCALAGAGIIHTLHGVRAEVVAMRRQGTREQRGREEA